MNTAPALKQEKIDELTQRIVQAAHPRRIILFGSAVRGKTTSDSDLDFFIVKEDVPHRGIDRMRQVRDIINTDMPCDFLVAKPSEVKKRLLLGDPFIKEIMEQGKVIYG